MKHTVNNVVIEYTNLIEAVADAWVEHCDIEGTDPLQSEAQLRDYCDRDLSQKIINDYFMAAATADESWARQEAMRDIWEAIETR